jgi:hypothetical protein
MPLTVKITPMRKAIDLIVNKNLSPQARREMIAAFARGKIAEADAKNARALGTPPPKTVSVDGRAGAPLESINPDNGIIIAEWRLTGDVLLFIYETLRARSPVLTGQYRENHLLYADGAEVDDPTNPPLNAQEYVFLNPEPYARKIEIGKTESGRDFVISVPNRIYERTAQDAAARFSKLAKIRFSYQAAVGGSLAKRGQTSSRVPAIVVTLR